MNLDNIYKYQQYEKEYITKSMSGIKNELKAVANKTCGGQLSDYYINKTINNFKYGFIYRNTHNYNNIYGFALWNIKNEYKPDAELHIKIICGKSLGKLIFNDIEYYAISHNINTITLEPGNDILKKIYEDKYGFKIRGYNKTTKLNTYYKQLNINSIPVIKKRKYSLKQSNNKRSTLKKKREINSNNNINIHKYRITQLNNI